MVNESKIYAALLRGVNVGGKGTVSMATLKRCFEEMGFKAVKTYINSGNVVFIDGTGSSESLAENIEKTLNQTFKFPISVVVKDLSQMQAIVDAFPKNWLSDARLRKYVFFLRPIIDKPSILEQLHPKANIEEVKYVPGALLWSADLDHLTTTDMHKLISSQIYKEMTSRNSNTTLKVYDLMKQARL